MKRERVPRPLPMESATSYADRLGSWCLSRKSKANRRLKGQYLTPVPVARFMAKQHLGVGNPLRILDPGAGAGTLSCAICEEFARRRTPPREIAIQAFEVDTELAKALRLAMTYLRSTLHKQGVSLRFEIRQDDFILAMGRRLDRNRSVFEESDAGGFDVAIANPPYFKLPSSDPRALLAQSVAHGQPNIYSLFMTVSASLLREGGELIVIAPRSFASGPYFKGFRHSFFSRMMPTFVHLFESRRQAFGRDGILQENIILRARKARRDGKRSAPRCTRISTSTGTDDLDRATVRRVPFSNILKRNNGDVTMMLPSTATQEAALALVESWKNSFSTYGIQVSTGPVVAFRARSHLRDRRAEKGRSAPLLWLHNVQPMSLSWPSPTGGKPQHIAVSEESRRLLIPITNMVLLRRFSAKEDRQRLVAGPLEAEQWGDGLLGLENHLNYIYRPVGVLSLDEVWGIAALLNGETLNAYFQVMNGNTQVSATEMRCLPLPELDEITELGRVVRRSPDSVIEDILCRVLRIPLSLETVTQ